MSTVTINEATGEIIEPAEDKNPRNLPVPETLDQANEQINLLTRWLSANSRERIDLRRKLQPVQDRYTAVYNAALVTSERGEAAQRKAEALLATQNEPAPDGSGVSLAERLSTLKLQLKVAEDLGHDVRSVLSSLQTVSKNLQADAYATGRQI